MNVVLYEDKFEYNFWLKLILVITVISLLVLGYLFYVDAYKKDIFPKEPAKESKIGAITMFASVAFTILVFWAVLPRKIYILQDKIQIKLGLFPYNIPFVKIKSFQPAKGIAWINTTSFVTSFGSQIEVVRKRGMKVRFSPSKREMFLDSLTRAMNDWKQTQ